MRILILSIVVMALLIGALALFLVLTAPSEARGLSFPLSGRDLDLLRRVPASADAFAILPTAAALESKLLGNPVTRSVIEEWTRSQPLPRPWMLGSADMIVWRQDKRIRYILFLDPLRAAVVRVYLMLYSDLGDTVSIAMSGEPPLETSAVTVIQMLASRLPRGDALVVQREKGRGAFPPIDRPAVTSLSIHPDRIDFTSRAAARAETPTTTIKARFARGALITAAFSRPPDLFRDLDRIVATKVSSLLSDGGAVALYEVDTGTLLPKPREVIILPATDARRTDLADFVRDIMPTGLREAIGVRVETADTGSELLVSFDTTTIARYRADRFEPQEIAATSWVVRLDPRRIGPVLRDVAGNPGLRLAAPRLFRSARDLEGWIDELERATSIEAGLRSVEGAEELQVVIRAK